ncbi:type VI secretion system membrane subunit TssM [Photorhabdus stackebrandtii]|uniref:Type VI secretion system membrane subunit TssM n=1 Tax=Photorhabdus stackebrandtii TaxID=1123042 RepID=A0A7X5QNU2_9GAMM|nr:type VI secretion system membrane subunit TssM [Photorhabdus stackebrandtii]NHB97796.1 type VI secretion system membrane subunit TssM [Photorhabdus stackebrandtii]
MNWLSLLLKNIKKPAMPRLPPLKATASLILALLPCIALIWIWWWGPGWQFRQTHPLENLSARWLATVIIILLALGFIGTKIWRRLRQLEKLKLDVELKEIDPVLADITHQDSYLNHWKEQLQRHLGTWHYLYQRPWYLMLGNTGSGKTALIQEGYKLTDIALPDSHKGEEAPPLHLRCWLGEKAVIIDPDGFLIDQISPSDTRKPQLPTRLWQSLLAWLTENRQRQPLNGIILTVDTHRLLTDNKAQRERYIAALHLRLQDLRLTLHNPLPFYLVLTKLDLLHGFSAAFQSLDKPQRTQILGVTFSLNAQDEHSWRTELAQFWHQWMQQLNAAMPDMMLNKVDISQRSPLFSFTRQIQGLHSYLIPLLEGILYNGGPAQPGLRGVYLTSSRQIGQMDDIFTQSAAVQYHLGPQAFPTWPVADTAPYFTRALFEDVLLAEPNLAAENRLWLSHHRRKLLTFSTAGAAVALALWAGWHYNYQKNYRAGEEVLAQAKTFLSIPPPKGEDRNGNLQLPLLNPLREATLAYGDYHKKGLFTDMGLYQGSDVGPYVENTYLQLLSQRFLPALMNGLLDDLNQAAKGSEEKLEVLRIMRMLEDRSGRNKSLVEQYMRERWSQVFNGQRQVQEQLLTHLDYALDHTDWRAAREADNPAAISRFAPYQRPMINAQKELSQLSIYQRVYQTLRIKAQDSLPPPLNLRDQIGPSFDSLFIANNDKQLIIPQFLTINGLNNYFVKQDDQLIDLTVMDSWVLNLSHNVQYSETDRQEIQRQITEQYLGDYTATWRGAMNNLDIRHFTDIPQAIGAIEQVISGEQPLSRALQILSDNTRLPVINDTLPAKEQQQLRDSPDYRLLVRINREFAPETAVLVEYGDKNSTLQGVYQKLTDLHRYLLAIQNAPVPGKAALKAVQLRLEQNNSDPIFEVQQLAKNLPEPLNRWVGELAEQAWRVVMREAVSSLEVEWSENVVRQYQTYLAGRYPFNPAATQDVPLSEFDRFFRPGGTLDAFYQQNLKPFVENNLTYGTDGEQLIRPDVLKQLTLANRIRDTFFTPQNGLGTQFAIEPLSLTGNKRRSLLNLDGQLLDYAHGRGSIVHLIWPNSMRAGVESQLTLIPDVSGKSPRAISFTGPWAQLRLINSGKLTNVRQDSFDVLFSVDGGDMTYRIYVDESDNPFAGGLFSQFTLPDTLY